MQPKLTRLKTPLGEFDAATWDGANRSRIKPTGDRVLVLPDQAAKQSSGGVHIPDETFERIALASETGILVAIGDGAFKFNSDRSRPYQGTPPAIGTRVFFERYAGASHPGADGQIYRLMDDKAIGGLVIEDEAPPDEAKD